MSERRWEPPIVKPLYVTYNRAAELLGVSYWKIWNLSFCLETRYFGERGGAPRILLASIEEFIELRDSGEDAETILRERRTYGSWGRYRLAAPVSPTRYSDPRRRHWRKNWWYHR